MSKNISKEIIIILLLCLAIILVMFALLYSYIPMNIMLPEPISYTTPQDIQEELKTTSQVDEDEVILTYTLDTDDLNNYQRINDYRPGKTNPFSTYKTQDEEKPDEEGNTTGTTSGGTSSGSSSSGSSSSSSGKTTTKSGTSTNTVDKSTPIEPGSVNPGNYTNNKGLK